MTRRRERDRRTALKLATGTRVLRSKEARQPGPPYLFPYVCFACRKSFKRTIDVNAPGLQDKVCPECGGKAVGLSRKFKAPARTDIAQWKKVEYLVRHGFRFFSLEGVDAVAYPKTLAEARTFVRRYGKGEA
jgi:DNA-directed RNA polymerase subunit RPC12/RpoP